MKHWLAKLTCVDGGSGWGKTGGTAEMCAPGETKEEAEAFVKLHLPGGWDYAIDGPTEETFYLRHIHHNRHLEEE